VSQYSRIRLLSVAVVCFVMAGVATGLAFARGTAAKIGNGVVVINTNLGYQDGAAAGTGMVLTSSGEILTNNHVIRGATTVKVVVPGTGHTYTARVVGYSVANDVAVLQAQNASNLKTLSLGDSSKVSVGQSVTALGNAGGTGRLLSAAGTVTGLNKAITASDEGSNAERLTGLIEMNAGIQPGDSGGPLLNRSGQAIGMDTAASSDSPYASSTATDAYAIPINKALTVARQIESGKSSSTVHIGGTAFLGIQVDPGSGDAVASGALIAAVIPNGAAAAAGLQAGDVITAINGRTIASTSTITSILLTKTPGSQISVTYVDQYGSSQTTTVTLGSGPAQ
jgi:S1-C subfamily serine protease